MLSAATKEMIIAKLATELNIDKDNLKFEEILTMVAVFAAESLTSIVQTFGCNATTLQISLYDLIDKLINIDQQASNLTPPAAAFAELIKVFNKHLYAANVDDKKTYTIALLKALVTHCLNTIPSTKFDNLIEDFCRELQNAVMPENRTLH